MATDGSMSRFYTNENLSMTLVIALRSFGHDVLTSFEAGNANQKKSDDLVLAAAAADERCVVTFNRNDFVALHRAGVEHCGIIICKDNREDEVQASLIHERISRQATIRNRLFRLLKQNQLGSTQPIFVVREYLRSRIDKSLIL
ncbi:MAG: DUF5615 family PIN-like protein [Cyanobacteria bacterium J06614_10]